MAARSRAVADLLDGRAARARHVPARNRAELRLERARGDRGRRRAQRPRRVREPARAARAFIARVERGGPNRRRELAPHWGSSEEPATLTVAGRAARLGGRAASGPSSSSCCDRTASSALNLAELGVGTNDRATLTGNVLEDEKILGTVHVAFGASAGIGGTVSVPIHLDVVVRRCEPEIDGAARCSTHGRYVLGLTRPPRRDRTLLAVPNVSEGRDRRAIDAIAARFDAPAARRPLRPRPPPHRVHARRRARGARASGCRTARPKPSRRVDLTPTRASIRAWARSTSRRSCTSIRADRGAACAEALVLADLLGRGARTARVPLRRSSRGGRTRAELRRGGPASSRAGSQRRADARTSARTSLHPTAGAVLVAARPPLVAFNVELAPPATLDDARAIAATIREGGAEGLPVGARDRAVARARAASPRSRPTSRTTARRRSRGRRGDRRATPTPAGAELVGLAPRRRSRVSGAGDRRVRRASRTSSTHCAGARPHSRRARPHLGYKLH